MYELIVTIESTNPNSKYLKEIAARQIELAFGDAAKVTHFRKVRKKAKNVRKGNLPQKRKATDVASQCSDGVQSQT